MRGLFLPAITLMNKLSYTKKFMVLGSIYLIAIVVMFSSLYNNFSQEITSTQRELQGVSLIKPVTKTMQLIQQYHRIIIMNNDSKQSELVKIENELIKNIMRIEERLPADTLLNHDSVLLNKEWRSIKTNWHSLRLKSENWSAEQNFAAYTEFLEQLQEFKETLADSYVLTFDANTDSHYLIDIVVKELPDVVEHIERLHTVSTEVLTIQQLSNHQKDNLIVLIGELNQSLKTVDLSLAKTGRTNPELQPLMNGAAKEILKANVQITNAVQSDILSKRFQISPNDFFALQAQTIDKIYTQSYETLLPSLEALLVQRINTAKKLLFESIGSAFLLFLLAQYFFIGIYYAMMGNIQSLAQSAQKFADGNLSVRFIAGTQDELAEIAFVFNEMAASFQKLLAAQIENTIYLQAVLEEQRIAAIAFETQEGIMITDANNVIIRVNKAFTIITGYNGDEAIGKTPSLLNSGQQDSDFYQQMWRNIRSFGSWRGEVWNRHKDGNIYPERLAITAVKDNYKQTTHYVATFADISEHKIAEEKIKLLAFSDALTGLANRRKLSERLAHSVDQCYRESTQLAVLMMDLDRFKTVNDTLGHLAGDELLKQVAQRITSRLRATDLVARLGGDEFVVVLEGLAHQDDAARIATQLVADLDVPFDLPQGSDVRIGASIGIALYPLHGETPDLLMDHADIALYQAKDSGRGCFAYFSESLTIAARARLDLEARLRWGIENGELRVFYQAQVDIVSGNIIGAEALVRWQEPNEGLIPPYKFIEIAEETGLIMCIGEWVLRNVCQQGKEWLDAGFAPIRLAVNVSPSQFKHCNMVELVTTILAETHYLAEQLELELTESAFMDYQDATVIVLTELRQLGIKLAIDDFGTGYSSLSYLKRFPLDVLKIDKSFIDDIPYNTDDMAITTAIISMGQSLGFKVLAEGVETLEQLEFLQRQGCDLYQGYIKSKPIPADEFVKLLTKLK